MNHLLQEYFVSSKMKMALKVILLFMILILFVTSYNNIAICDFFHWETSPENIRMLKRESYIIAASLLLSSPFVQFNWAYEDSIFKMCWIPDFDLLILEQIFFLIY